MTPTPDRTFPRDAAHVLVWALAVVLGACVDNVRPADPLVDGQYPSKAEFLELNPKVAEIPDIGDRIKLEAAVRDARGRAIPNATVKWEATDPSIATVDGSGNVTGLGEGVTEIRGSSGGMTDVAVVAVAKRRLRWGGSSSTASVAISPESDTVPVVGATVKLLAVGRDASGKLVTGDNLAWSSDNPAVATVSGGVVTANSSGETEIIVKNGPAADTATIAVAPPTLAASVVVTPDADTIPSVGGSVTLLGQVLNGTGGVLDPEVSWTSLDPSVASVIKGVVTGTAKGVARIRAYYGALADTAMIWVAPTPSATSVFVTPKLDTIPQVGGTKTLIGTALDGSGNAIAGVTFTWNTLDPSIATATAAGVVKGVAKGTARILLRLGTLVDTATIIVAPTTTTTTQSPSITITPKVDTIPAIGGWAFLATTIKDAAGKTVNTIAAWKALDPTIATVVENGEVQAVAKGVARITATWNGIADTAVVHVAPTTSTGGGTTTTASLVLSPKVDTIPAIGGWAFLAATIKDAQGKIVNSIPVWQTLDPAVAEVVENGEVRGLAKGTARIRASYNGLADTAVVHVAPSGTTTGGTAVSVSHSPGSPTTTMTVNITATVTGTAAITNVSLTVDGTVKKTCPSSPCTYSSLFAAGSHSYSATATESGGKVVNSGQNGFTVWSATSGGSQLTPAGLRAVLGPLVGLNPNPPQASLKTYDQRYAGTELARFNDYLAMENDPAGAYLGAQHYGGLRARLMWAIRTGEPFGAGVTDETKYAYARGRRIVKRYLQYSKANSFATQPHNNTGLADIEALYVLEGDPDALTHLHVSAMYFTTDTWGYLKMQDPNADARQIAVGLQAFMAADRLGIPYVRSPANTSMGFDASLGSWKAAGQRQIDWLTQYGIVKQNGAVPSPAHGGAEAYLFNAWLATSLLQWYGNTQSDPTVLQLAKRIMDHLIASLPATWTTLGYLSTDGTPAPDLAAFYVWPSLVLWQETGDTQYYNFAMKNLEASNGAFINGIKQWNQTFSTLAQSTAALIAGSPWH